MILMVQSIPGKKGHLKKRITTSDPDARGTGKRRNLKIVTH